MHLDLNGPPTVDCLWYAHVASYVSIARHRPVAVAVAAPAAPVQKRPAPRWHGYGFLPGYHQPLNNSLPLYNQKDAIRRWAAANGVLGTSTRSPDITAMMAIWHYFGRPGFYGGRYNGGSFGPCWTQTPIGPVWNCG